MAGMIPGVESARRRRFRQGGSVNSPVGGSRRLSFCLYTTNCETHFSSNSLQRTTMNKVLHGGELGNIAREAKDRLDEKLRNQRATEIMSSIGTTGGRGEGLTGPVNIGRVQREAFSLRKLGSRKFNWSKLGWKASEQAECAVCLEEFKTGDMLVHLPCAHRFHGSCVVPWLESSSHCPCCRMNVPSTNN